MSGHGFPAKLWRALDRHPPPGVRRLARFRSPLRGPWLTSVFGLVLLVTLPLVTITGLLSYIAYAPQLGQAIPGDVGWLHLPTFTWPTRPSWLYRLTQGLHVGLGLVIVPVVLAKLWSVIPRLFVWPPARSIAQVLERLSLLMLVGGALFEIVTGVLNIQYDYVFGFSFYTGHYFGAWVFIAGFLMHIAVKVPRMITGLRSLPLREVVRTNRAHTRPQPPDPDGLASVDPAEPTMSRRGALALVGSGALLIGALTAGQTLGGAARGAALLLPRGRGLRDSKGDFPVNKTAIAAGITPENIGASWRLTLGAAPRRWCSTAPRWSPCRKPPRGCRSPASRDGRRCRPGAGCGWPSWPGSRACRHHARRAWHRCNGAAHSVRRRCRPTRLATPTPCWRCGSTAPTCRRITAIRRGSSFRRCPACTTPNGFRPSSSSRAEMSLLPTCFSGIYGSRPLHLLTMLSGFALFGYILATFKPATLWNPGAWWQSIAVWLAAAVIGHDLLLFPLYALADRALFARIPGEPPQTV